MPTEDVTMTVEIARPVGILRIASILVPLIVRQRRLLELDSPERLRVEGNPLDEEEGEPGNRWKRWNRQALSNFTLEENTMGQKGAKLTSEATEVADWLVDKLATLGNVTSRKMFGGYGIFESGSMFALVTSKGTAHLKVDDSNRAKFEKAGSEQHGRMPYFAIPAKVLNNTRSLRAWASASLAVAKSAK